MTAWISGLPGLKSETWGTQPRVGHPALAQQLAKLATTVASDDLATPEGLSAFLKVEVAKWNQTLNAMHVTPE